MIIQLLEVLMTEISFLGELDFLKPYLVPYFLKVSCMHFKLIYFLFNCDIQKMPKSVQKLLSSTKHRNRITECTTGQDLH